MLKARDLFPREAPDASGLPIQAKIMIRTAHALLSARDVRKLIEQGSIVREHDPDEAHRIAVHGW